MAELIQFHCPGCGTILRLPLTMAAHRGPCPACSHDIVAPDPHLGLAACLAPPPATAEPEPFVPFGEPPPPPSPDPVEDHPTPNPVPDDLFPTRETPPEPAPATPLPSEPVAPAFPPPTPPIIAQCPSSPHRAILILSIFLTAVTCLAAGYLLGLRSDWIVANTPAPVFPNIPPNPQTQPAEPTPAEPQAPPATPAPAASAPPGETPPDSAPAEPEPIAPPAQPAPDPPPAKASDAAAAALKAFLTAPDWATRSAHVLDPESVRPEMETHARLNQDGPIEHTAISLANSHTDTESGETLFVFQVTTAKHPSGIPAAVAESPNGWLVDWSAFIEFHDDRFLAFADGPVGKTASFHLLVSAPPPDRAANTDNEHFASFLLDPPLPNRQRLAYVRKSLPDYHILAQATADRKIFTPVLTLSKRSTPDGKSYLEIDRINANDWLPASISP